MVMKKLFLAILVMGHSCNQNKAPKDLIPQQQMIQLITEIHLLESKINYLNIRPLDSAKLVYQHYENILFVDFNITRDQYERSFDYYIDNIDEFQSIYDAVVDTLLQQEKLETY